MAIKEYLKGGGGALIVDDKKITVMISDSTPLAKDALDLMCDTSRRLCSLDSASPSSKKGIAARIFNTIVVLLTLAFALAVIVDVLRKR
jgi:hypothetical protein